MLHSQSDQAQGRADFHTPDPGTHTAPPGQAENPTLQEFLSHLSRSPDARSAFEADPQASLEQAGLGELTATDVLQATSLVLDYAPVEVVEEYGRSLQSSVEKFAAGNHQHVAFNHIQPAHPPEEMDHTMLSSKPQPSNGDADAHILPAAPKADGGDQKVNVEDSAHGFVAPNVAPDVEVKPQVGDVASNNEVAPLKEADINVLSPENNKVDNSQESESNSLSNHESAVNDVTSVVGDVPDLVGGIPQGATETVGGVTEPVQDVTGSLPVDSLPVAGDLPL